MPGPHETITVQFHLGAEHTRFDANTTDTLAALKQTALANMQIVLDPGVDYLLSYQGETIENETQTLGQLLGEHPRPHVEFHVKKRPKGGCR